MKAGVIVTGTGPVLMLTSYDSLTEGELVKKLAVKGIAKYIAYEVDESLVKERYGNHYEVVLEDLHQEDDLRILDYDGHHIFNTFSLKELGEPVVFEPEASPVLGNR